MGAGLDMDVDATESEMNKLPATGEDLATLCRAAASDIRTLSGALGRGPLGERFAGSFYPGRGELEDQIAGTYWVPEPPADVGRDCVRNYASTDAHAEAELLPQRAVADPCADSPRDQRPG